MYPAKKLSQKELKKFGKFLSNDEQLIIATGISTRFFISEFIKLFPLALIIIGLPHLSKLIRLRASLKYLITDKRFLIINGIFSRKITTAPLDRITHITVEQSFAERFFYNCGQLVIITAGYDQREIVIDKISNPIELKILIGELSVAMGRDQPYQKPEEINKEKDEQKNLRPLKIG